MILLVDDDDSVRNVACQMLERSGFEVLSAADGEEGLRLLSENQGQVKLALLDLTMPKMGGDVAFDNMRAIQPELLGILSTGHGLKDRDKFLSQHGFAAVISKPFRMSELIDLINKTLTP